MRQLRWFMVCHLYWGERFRPYRLLQWGLS